MGDRTGKALQFGSMCSEVEVFGLGPQPMHMPYCELEFSPQPCALLFPCRKWNWSLCLWVECCRGVAFIAVYDGSC